MGVRGRPIRLTDGRVQRLQVARGRQRGRFAPTPRPAPAVEARARQARSVIGRTSTSDSRLTVNSLGLGYGSHTDLEKLRNGLGLQSPRELTRVKQSQPVPRLEITPNPPANTQTRGLVDFLRDEAPRLAAMGALALGLSLLSPAPSPEGISSAGILWMAAKSTSRTQIRELLLRPIMWAHRQFILWRIGVCLKESAKKDIGRPRQLAALERAYQLAEGLSDPLQMARAKERLFYLLPHHDRIHEASKAYPEGEEAIRLYLQAEAFVEAAALATTMAESYSAQLRFYKAHAKYLEAVDYLQRSGQGFDVIHQQIMLLVKFTHTMRSTWLTGSADELSSTLGYLEGVIDAILQGSPSDQLQLIEALEYKAYLLFELGRMHQVQDSVSTYKHLLRLLRANATQEMGDKAHKIYAATEAMVSAQLKIVGWLTMEREQKFPNMIDILEDAARAIERGIQDIEGSEGLEPETLNEYRTELLKLGLAIDLHLLRLYYSTFEPNYNKAIDHAHNLWTHAEGLHDNYYLREAALLVADLVSRVAERPLIPAGWTQLIETLRQVPGLKALINVTLVDFYIPDLARGLFKDGLKLPNTIRAEGLRLSDASLVKIEALARKLLASQLENRAIFGNLILGSVYLLRGNIQSADDHLRAASIVALSLPDPDEYLTADMSGRIERLIQIIEGLRRSSN